MKKQRKGSKPAVPQGAPVFFYTSTCCNVQATKPPLVKTPEKDGTLGTWRCTGCGKSCKCARSKAKTEEKNNVSR